MFRVKAENVKTGKSLVLLPVFNDRDEAQKWADDFFGEFGVQNEDARYFVIETDN